MIQPLTELRHTTDRHFIDISSESLREYCWADGSKAMIVGPQWLAISESGHYILDAEENSYFVPFGWRILRWEAKEYEPHFV